LNPAGRVVLIKSVLSSFPIFQFSSLHAPGNKKQNGQTNQKISFARGKGQREKSQHGQLVYYLVLNHWRLRMVEKGNMLQILVEKMKEVS
jgi:hypothetical protein